jgi:hypothetical protein
MQGLLFAQSNVIRTPVCLDHGWSYGEIHSKRTVDITEMFILHYYTSENHHSALKS